MRPTSELVAFSDANATWAPDALRLLVRSFADPEVAYVCGRLVLETADGSNREGVYWRYELAQRAAESRLGSITGGNGSIYAVRRSDYVEVDPKWGHDLSFPYRMVQAGRRAIYDPAARASEKPTPTNETEYRRKVRMFEHCWEIALRGSMLKRLPPGYLAAVISHRVLRYGSGVLHVVLLGGVHRARRRGLALPGGSRRPALLAGRRRARRRARALLRPRHLGDARRALELPPPRRPGDVDPAARRRGREPIGGYPMKNPAVVLDSVADALANAVRANLLAMSVPLMLELLRSAPSAARRRLGT